MLKNERILITGITAPTAVSMATALVKDNEVWGAARFTDPAGRAPIDVLGVKTVSVDLGQKDLSALPSDFTYVLHLAYFRSPKPDFEEASRVNGAAVGYVFSHCRKAKAALYMSSHVIYSVYEDPCRPMLETDLIGAAKPGFSATSMVSKIAGETMARYCAPALDLPVVVARLNAPYGPLGGLPVTNVDSIAAGKPVFARWDPEPYAPIHVDDMAAQLPAMLDSASTPANIVNWAGDEPVTVRQWRQYAAQWSGNEAQVDVRPPPFSLRGSLADVIKRRSITGPCRVPFKEELKVAYDQRLAAAKA